MPNGCAGFHVSVIPEIESWLGQDSDQYLMRYYIVNTLNVSETFAPPFHRCRNIPERVKRAAPAFLQR